MSEEIKGRFITNPSQLGPPPKLRRKIVELPEWKLSDGGYAQFYVHELTALEHVEYQRSMRKYENGRHVGVDTENADLKLLSFILRDPHGNRPWPTPEASVSFFNAYSARSLEPIFDVYNGLPHVDESVEDIEGKSEKTSKNSSS